MKNFNIKLLFFILVLGFSARVSLIQFGLPSKNLALTTYNPDEPLSFYTIEQWEPNKLNFHPHRAFLWGGFHLFPLAFSLGIAKIFGYVKFADREFYISHLKEADKLYLVGRFLMILFATCSILVIFIILKETYTETAGLFGSLLLAIAPLHIFNSIYVRPDIMMMFFGLLSLYFSVRMVKTGKTENYILSCLSVGFATGTKLSGCVYGICPLIAHFLTPLNNNNKKLKDIRLYLIPVICLLGFVVSSPYIILDFNKTSESFISYLKQNLILSRISMDFGQLILLNYGPLSYFKYYLSYGLGKIMVIISVLGIILILFNIVKRRNNFDILFTLSGIVVLLIISSTKNQAVWYTFPFIPFCVIYTVRGIEILYEQKSKLLKLLSVILSIFLVSYTLVYTISHWKLYKQKNVREEASEWILKNIPQGSKIAIARSYFWTPPVLRQYNPPYEVLMGTDPIKSSVYDGVLGLKNLLDKAEYIVLTEYEYRWVIHPKVKKYFQEHAEIIDRIFNSGEFVKLAEFDKQAKFLFFTFKKNYLPGDWLIPNPKIVVFKKVNTK